MEQHDEWAVAYLSEISMAPLRETTPAVPATTSNASASPAARGDTAWLEVVEDEGDTEAEDQSERAHVADVLIGADDK